MKIEINNVSVLINTDGMDIVMFELIGMSSPFTYMCEKSVADIKVTKDYGIAWAKHNFPDMPITTIDCKTGKRRMIE